MAEDKHSSIERRAYEIWEREGRPHGAHDRHWREAESEIEAMSATKVKPAKRTLAASAAKTAKAAKPATSPKAAKPKAAAAKKG